jgi:3-deoxy-manno-octulosonate cytidylyltransferase (CMP-KDO synthetase)
MTVLAVIPARLGATRLPGKPLRPLGGLPLVVRVFERVQAAAVAERAVVATDAPDVLEACRAHGVPVVMTASTHPSGTDRVAEVAARAEFAGAQVVLNVQGDEPFVSADALHAAVQVVRSGRAAIGTVAAPADDALLAQPDVVKVVCRDDGQALYFSRAPIPFLREPADRALLDGTVRQHLGIYAYTPEALGRWVALPPHRLERIERLEQLRPLAHGMPIGVADVAPPVFGGIDTEADLAHANARWDDLTLQAAAAAASSTISGTH